MDFLLYLLQRSWSWMATNGLAIAALLILIVLVPRIRRFVIAVATGNMADGEESTKGRRALIGAVVYIVEMIAYFVIGLALLNQFGVSLTAAAVPATVVSAAIGFGAQGVIGDLIGGVFIIAEKQYGIGDWVEFHSPSGTVQGEVVNMTLRATTIRTLNGEEVVVPNAQARMCVNYSSAWSRAVIEIPVPMTAGGSVRDLEERTLEAAKRAIDASGVREHVLSEIRIQSSTELVPPTAMGLPWTVTMRLIADCEPGDQWLIERAVRGEIIDTWWDDYGERAESNPLKSAEALTAQLGAIRRSPVTRPDEDEPVPAPAPDPADAAARRGEGSLEVEQANAAKAAQASHGSLDDDADHRRSDLPSAGAAIDDRRRRAEDAGEVDETAAADPAPQKPMSRRQRVRQVLSAGGRARPSTVVMIVALMILGMLNLATVEPGEDEEGVAGWLAPSRFTGDDEADTATETPTEPAPDANTGTGTDPNTGTGTGGTTTAPTTPNDVPRQQSGTDTGNTPGTGNTGNSGNTGTGTDTGTGTGTGTDSGTGTGTGDTGTGTGDSAAN
ncbi:mechanosensitive ion channel family protein [Corynebacterium sp. NPDC060344]|uniref:mechanosensitive ion channel family protein n=1 Tax=Corynebacterium sp. NPDC060344 TaxID=3347101 RepID=UPI00364F4EDE